MQSGRIFKRILVPTDGSLPSLIAQELTVFIAKKFKSEVTVLHVVSHEFMNPKVQEFFAPTDYYAPVSISEQTGTGVPPIVERVSTHPGSSIPEKIEEEITALYHQKGDEAIANAVALFREEGIPVDQRLVEHADPAGTIIKEAQDGNYDLIVMGHSGEKEEELHLGSVAKKVSMHSKIPVLIAKERRQISKILVPVDGSESAEKALQYAVPLAQKTDATMTLLYVQDPGIFNLRPELSKKVGTRILSKAAEEVEGITPEQKLESGDPAKMTIQTAKNGDYDIIVIGSKGQGSIGRFLLGSVSDHIIHYADRSVLLIK
jgi:nucleotide-binding universal stress UspA family protein